jgi:hypothetical protein
VGVFVSGRLTLGIGSAQLQLVIDFRHPRPGLCQAQQFPRALESQLNEPFNFPKSAERQRENSPMNTGSIVVGPIGLQSREYAESIGFLENRVNGPPRVPGNWPRTTIACGAHELFLASSLPLRRNSAANFPEPMSRS